MRVYFAAIARTPFRRIFTGFENFDCLKLGVELCNKFIEKHGYAKNADLFLASSVLLDPEVPNLGREIVIRSNLDKTTPGHFVSNYCISSLVSTGLAFSSIKAGLVNSAICLGVEVMSAPKLFLTSQTSRKIADLVRARGVSNKLRSLLNFRLSDLKLLFPSPKEPSTGLTMGESCEIMNELYCVSREDQDAFALESHRKAAGALGDGIFSDDLIDIAGIRNDNLIRPDSSLEKLSSLKPVFKKSGTLTAGNSSPLTDGASIGFIVSERLLESFKIRPVCEIVDCVFVSVSIEDGLLMAPVVAIQRLLERAALDPDQIDIWEIHEAFACQALINLRVLESGWENYGVKPTKIPRERVNIFGGSLAYGHPFSATGLRLILHAAKALKLIGKKYALVASCAAGGGGAAVVIKNPDCV